MRQVGCSGYAVHMTDPARTPLPIIDHIAPLAPTADLWLVDIWGVMHNGVRPFDTAVAACRRFRDEGGTVLLLSNAPRPADAVQAQLDRIGVPRWAYDAILSSGDAARALIAAAVAEGKRIGHLGPERDLPLFEGLSATLVPLGDAGVVVCTGLRDDTTETPATYSGELAALAQRSVPMICANPDLQVERGGAIVYCAGALAATYEALGQRVTYAGKPYLPIYDQAFALVARLRGGAVSRSRTLAIGDGIRTDIAGAAAVGVRAVFVASGIHVAGEAGLDDAELSRLFGSSAVRPVAAMRQLDW